MSKQSVIADLKSFAEAVEALAFKMPAPNEWTPQFLQLVVQARQVASRHQINDRADRLEKMRKLQRLGQEADATE